MTTSYTAGELTKLRTDGQQSRYYLAIAPRTAVFAARINQTFSTLDPVRSITFDTVTTGAYTAIVSDMTCYIGTSAGAYDIGVCRIRKAATSTKIFISPSSEMALADNQYITVVNSYQLWPRLPYTTTAGDLYMDFDVEYSAQHSATKPTVNLGAPKIVWLTGATVTVSFDASASWNLAGGALTYAWTFAGAASSTGTTTSTPTATYNAAGTYQAKVIVTAGGVASTRYEYVYVYSAASQPVTAFDLTTAPAGDYMSGGWQFGITLFAEAGISTLPNQAEVILFSRDYYQGSEAAIGANCWRGWIDTETLTSDPLSGNVSVMAYGPNYWLEKIQAPIMTQVYGTTLNWHTFSSLTVDAALWHYVTWRSTITNVIDVYKTGDTRTAAKIETADGSLWQGLKFITSMIMGDVCTNAQGNLFAQIDTQMLPTADRSSIPNVITLGKQDWRDNLIITRKPTSAVSMVMLTGVIASGANTRTVYSLASGHARARTGMTYSRDGILASTQAAQNVLAGLILSHENRPYDFDIPMAHIGHGVDIAPNQYITLAIASGDTPRSIAYSGKAIVRSIQWGDVDGVILPTYQAEAETFVGNYVNGDVPINNAPDDVTPIPPVPMPDLPPLPGLPPAPPVPIPPWAGTCADSSPATGPYTIVWSQSYIDGSADVARREAIAWKRCTIRSATATNPTVLYLDLRFTGQAASHFHVYGIDGTGATLCTGIITAYATAWGNYYVTFSEVAAVNVAGFKIVLDEGFDTTSAGFTRTLNSLYQYSFYGYLNPASTLTETVYTPASGIQGSLAYVKFKKTNAFAGVSIIHEANFTLPAGSTGTLYAMIDYILLSHSDIPPVTIINNYTSSWSPVQRVSNYSGTFAMYEKTALPAEAVRPTFWMQFPDTPLGGALSEGELQYFLYWVYSATIPARSISINTSNLFNVCPAE